jgi:hypothetical protein
MSEGTKAVVLDYGEVDEDRKDVVRQMKVKAADYFDAIVEVENHYGLQRDFSLAKTHLQEASMWVTRGITNPET